MKIREIYYEDEMELTTDYKVGKEIVDNYIDMKEYNQSEEKPNKCKILYSNLSQDFQYIVNDTIRALLPNKVFEHHFGEYFSAILDDTKSLDGTEIMNTNMLASMLENRDYCLKKQGKQEFFYGDTAEDLRSKLNSFKKKKKSIESTEILQEEICKILSIDDEVLTRGQGMRYSIDYENLSQILSRKRINSKEFFNELLNDYIECNKCKYGENCEYSLKRVEYTQYDKISLGHAIAKRLDVELSEIVQATEIIIEPDEFPWEEYFERLNRAGRLAINNLIVNLYRISCSK